MTGLPCVAVLEPSGPLRRHFEELVAEAGFPLHDGKDLDRPALLLLSEDALEVPELRDQARSMVAAGAHVITLAFPESMASGLVLRRPFSPAALQRSLRAAAGDSGVTWPHPETSAPRVVVDADVLDEGGESVTLPLVTQQPRHGTDKAAVDEPALSLLREFAAQWGEAGREEREPLVRTTLQRLREMLGDATGR